MPQSYFLFRRAIYFLCMIYLGVSPKLGYAQKQGGEHNYALNRPGVVMIKTVFSANVYVNQMKMDNKKFNNLLDSIQRLDTGGVIFTAEQKLDIVLREMNNNPNRFFKATLDYIKQPEEITSTGTGFFITADGYVATNSHLIDRENAFIRRRFILSAFQQITEANIEALENSWAATFTEQQRNLLYNTYASVYSRLFSMVLYDLKKDVYVVYSGNSKESTAEKKPATVIIKGKSMPGKDVAILKIDGENALPTLKVSDDELPKVGEQLYVYGYPGPVTNNDFVAIESAIEPTLTTGIVSAIKKSVDGWPLIQMDANISHGSSGGPVCNADGEVVGLTTFGSLENNGELAAGFNFAIPVTILREYLDTADIIPQVSKASVVFGEAIQFLEKKFYHKALNRFEKVQELNKNYPGLNNYISSCQLAIQKGEDQEGMIIRKDLMIFAILFLFLAAGYFYFRKKKYRMWNRSLGSGSRESGVGNQELEPNL
jgi:serine protease Do